MLVEISDKTLQKAKAFDVQGRLDMTVEEWAAFKMEGLSICNNLIFDIGMQEARNDLKSPEIFPGTMDALNSITIGNKD